MRVLICGGRDFNDYEKLRNVMDAHMPNVSTVISGMARGADTLGVKWAQLRGVEVARYPADWSTHGRAAGFVRNQQMLDEGKPNLVVAFPGGRGTADMVRRSRAAGVPVQEVT